MTNEHIEVVKRWQAGEDVSHEALKANAYNAEAAYVAAARAANAAAVNAARAAYAAARAAYTDEYAAARAADAAGADYWVKRYEELSNK